MCGLLVIMNVYLLLTKTNKYALNWWTSSNLNREKWDYPLITQRWKMKCYMKTTFLPVICQIGFELLNRKFICQRLRIANSLVGCLYRFE